MTKSVEVRKPKVIHIEFTDLDDETLYMDYDLSEVSPRHIAIAIVNLAQDLSPTEVRALLNILETVHTDKMMDDNTKRLSN